MKPKISIYSILASIALVITLVLANVDRTLATDSSTPVGRIILVENDSQITAGKLLYSSDTLQPTNGANVVALCYNNGDTWNVPSGNVSRVSDRCQPTVVAIVCDQKNGCYDRDGGRGGRRNADTPYIISPYKTVLIDDRPPISWHVVPGITDYTVRIKDITGTGVNWERTANITGDEIRWDYPCDVQALQPGREYKLTVEAKIESPENRVQPGESSFDMLNAEDIKQVQDVVDRINNLNIPKEEKYLQDLYSLYQGKKLISEIREMLESLVKEGSQTAQVYRKLGDLYLNQGLLDLAKNRYETSIKLARKEGDNKELEAAQTGLEQVNAALAI